MNLLLHTCCAPCSTSVIERLRDDGYTITLFYYNPNIHPKNEYDMRLNEIKKFVKQIGITLIEAIYDNNVWFEKIKGLENEPEKGDRCTVCYQIRLEKTAIYAKENHFDVFTSTLSISPYKDAKKLNKIGRSLSEKIGIDYLESDFKKKNGFLRSSELSIEFNLRRQDYCGCIYSKNK